MTSVIAASKKLIIAKATVSMKPSYSTPSFHPRMKLAMVSAETTAGNLYKPVLQLIIESFAVHRFTLR